MPHVPRLPDEPPGVHTARRLLNVGCAEQTVRQVLVTQVGLSLAEAERAMLAARAGFEDGSRLRQPRLLARPSAPTRRTLR
ncbi:MAG: hypothetical protein ACT4OX_16985 [Actinomycetota bacterium]